MRKMLLLIIWLSSAVRCQHPKICVSAQEGGLAKISCPYDSGNEAYPKYFYKAPAPPKPPLVTSNPPVSTTVQTITRNHQQPAVSDSSSTTLWPTPPADMYTGNKLYFPVVAAAAAAAAVLLPMVFFNCCLRKHRHDTGSTFGGEAAPWINTWSTVLYMKSQNSCSIRSLYTEARDPHISDDSCLLYSSVCFNPTEQPTSSHPLLVKQ